MLYQLLVPWAHRSVALNVFRYVTFRSLAAAATALVLCLMLGPRVVAWLRRIKVGQVVRADGPAAHRAKQGTPTMGGVLILASIELSTLLWADLTNRFVWLVALSTLFLGAVGFVDDYLKVARRHPAGLGGRRKLVAQAFAGLAVGGYLLAAPPLAGQLWKNPELGSIERVEAGVPIAPGEEPSYRSRLTTRYASTISIPFFKNALLDLGWLYLVFAALVVVGASNAVNLTDGLDGLAIGCSVFVALVYLVFSYLAGNWRFSLHLYQFFVEGAGELTIFCAAFVGAGLGFLWWNAYPAEVFMGDVGSLALGGAIASVALVVKQELLLILAGGIFVVEALSVMVQVGYFKATRGRRIFRMAPLHHHFELLGWAEPKVVVRFWIVGIALALLALTTIKLR